MDAWREWYHNMPDSIRYQTPDYDDMKGMIQAYRHLGFSVRSITYMASSNTVVLEKNVGGYSALDAEFM